MAFRQVIDDALRRYCEAFENQMHKGPAFSEFAIDALQRSLRERQLRNGVWFTIDETAHHFQNLDLQDKPHSD